MAGALKVLAGNQKGFARGVKKSGIPREELFICGSVVSQLAQARHMTARHRQGALHSGSQFASHKA